MPHNDQSNCMGESKIPAFLPFFPNKTSHIGQETEEIEFISDDGDEFIFELEPDYDA